MKQKKKSKRTVMVVQDAEACQRLLDIAARADAKEGIRQGLDDVRKGGDEASGGILQRIRT